MLPLGDENPTRLTPIVNWTLIVACIAAFVWQSTSGSEFFWLTLYSYGVVPARVAAGGGLYTFFTNIFLHGGWSHLLGNMLFLFIFGDNIEDCCGHLRYLAFYLVCGVAASGLWVITDWGSTYPAVGASGAISGVLGAYFIFYPSAKIRTLVSFGYFFRVIRVKAFTMIGLWFAYQFLLALVPLNTGVAYWAHVGGFVVGIVLSRLIKPKIRQIPTYSDLDYYR
ncbi:MAG TPA: rhomboid family intramembrane serine protease [Patescibacteria group bacterium]|nr:rhomboid family intramembrane serine protease [Patescibacteria group bacterium]